MSTTLWMCIALALLAIYVFVNQQSFRSDVLNMIYLPEHTVMALIYQFTRTAQAILFFGILPFFIIKLHFNFDAKKNSLFFDPRRPKSMRSRASVLASGIGVFCIIAFAMYWCPRFTQGPILYHFYAETLGSLFFFVALEMLILTLFSGLALVLYTAFWRYIGPYDKSVEEYLDQNGKIITEAELTKRKECEQ